MIAVDAMGGDFAPDVAVRGAYTAVKNTQGLSVTLFGKRDVIEALLNACDVQWRNLPITTVDCSTVVGMGDEPTRDLLQKKDSSLFCAIEAVAQNKAQAVVSAGNSGAALVAGIVLLGKVPGVMRPALGTFLPTKKGTVFLLDIGANTDCKAEYLKQFGLMGNLFVKQNTTIARPRVALLSNGEERYKGSLAVKSAFDLLEKTSLQFVGNIESRELFNDSVDVIVCDGFVGNVLLKAVQGTVQALTYWIKDSYTRSLYGNVLGYLSKPFMKSIKDAIDYRKQGGALLLGLNHPLIISHGCSDEHAIEQAILFAHETVQKKVLSQFNEALTQELVQESAVSVYDALKLDLTT